MDATVMALRATHSWAIPSAYALNKRDNSEIKAVPALPVGTWKLFYLIVSSGDGGNNGSRVIDPHTKERSAIGLMLGRVGNGEAHQLCPQIRGWCQSGWLRSTCPGGNVGLHAWERYQSGWQSRLTHLGGG